MTDTPRSLAAIKALFADNATGGISPQDLRDFVVSGSTFYGPGLDNMMTIVCDIPFPTGITIPSTPSFAYLPYKARPTEGEVYDPQEWAQYEDDYESPDWYGETVPAGSWLLLPEGVYIASTRCAWDDSVVGYRTAYGVDTCDNRSGDGTLTDPWAWEPLYANYIAGEVAQAAASLPLPNPAYRIQMATSFVRVTAATAPVAFASFVSQNTGSDVTLLAATIQLMRISPVGG